MKWFLVAMLLQHMEAFYVGTEREGLMNCASMADTLHGVDRGDNPPPLPKRVITLIEHQKVAALLCVDGDTVAELVAGRYGGTTRIEDGAQGVSENDDPPSQNTTEPPSDTLPVVRFNF